MTTQSPILSVDDLRVTFASRDRRTVKAVDGVSFDIEPGETFGIIGESGSGKTTLGRAIAGLVRPASGTIRHEGVDLAALSARALRQARRPYQIVFQDSHAALDPRMTAGTSVCEPLVIVGGMSGQQANEAMVEMLRKVGLGPDIARRYPHQLSGGQKQRVNIARALIIRPKLLVCDEVVAALDVSIQAEVLNLFTDLQQEFHLTYAFISHDLGVVSHVSDRVAVMYLGRFVEMGAAADIMAAPMHPYTQALLSAEPEALPSRLRTQRRIVLEGEIPSPIDPPSGCRFRTRCAYATATCAEVEPSWRPVSPTRYVACHYAPIDGSDRALSGGTEAEVVR